MSNSKKRLISLLMAFVMCPSLMPASAYSEDDIVDREGVEEAVALTSDWNYSSPQIDKDLEEDSCKHEWTDEEILEEATCVKQGLAAHSCKICKKDAMYDLPAFGHMWDNGIKTINENNEEVIVYTCKFCSETTTQIESNVVYEWSNLSDEEFVLWVRDSNHEVYIKNLLETKGGEEYLTFINRVNEITDDQLRNTVKEYVDSLDTFIPMTMQMMTAPLTTEQNDNPNPTFPITGTDGDIQWSINESGLLQISLIENITTGVIKDYALGTAPWYSNRDSVKTITIGDGITSIGSYAFSGMNNADSINIPSGMSNIGQYAFYQCTKISNIVFPDSVTSLGNSSLSGCAGLSSVTWPTNLTDMGSSVLEDCTSLKSYIYPSNLSEIAEGTFCRCIGITSVAIPSTVTAIGANAFGNCSGLSAVTIPNTVTSIGDGAFSTCPNLVIYGQTGTCAETYANNNNIPFRNPGDAPPDLTDITVQPEIIVLNKKTQSGYEGTQFILSAYPTSAILRNVNVTSSDANFIVAPDTTVTNDEHTLTYNLVYTGTEPAKTKLTVTSGTISKIIQVKTEDSTGVPATKIEVSTEGNKTTVGLGKTLKFNSTISPDDAETNEVVWTIDGNVDPSHATISSNGLLSVSESCTESSLTVRASTQGEGGPVYSTKTVSVKSVPTSVDIETNDTIYKKVNDTYTMGYSILPADASQEVNVESSNPDIVAVSDDKKTLTAKAIGNATITVTSTEDQNVKGIYSISVVESVVPVTSVTISNTETEINAGTSCVLSASVQPDNATDKTVAWSIADADAIGVKIQKINNKDCLVVDKTCTKQSLTVRAESVLTSGVADQKTFTIKPAPTSITIDTLSTIYMQVNDRHEMTYAVNPSNACQDVVISSNQPTVADVEYINGKTFIVAKGIGTANIKVASAVDETVSSTYLVCVEVPVESVTITAGRTDTYTGDIISLGVKVLPEDATYYGVNWSVTKAAVDYIRIIGSGSSYTLMIREGCPNMAFTLTGTLKGTSKTVKDSIDFTVKSKPTKITINPAETEMYTHDEYQLKPEFTPKDAISTVSYSSSDSTVATVSDTGKITTTGKTGEATVTVTSKANKNVSAKFEISSKEGISVFGYDNAQTLYAGKSLQMEVSPNRKMGEKLTTQWSVSDSDNADISGSGILVASASITPKILTVYADVTDEDGIKANGQGDIYVYNRLALLNENGVEISSSISIDLASKTTYSLTPEMAPLQDASDYVDWESSNETVATVDENGKVSFLSTGTVKITATTNDGYDVSSSATFIVKKSSSGGSSSSSSSTSTKTSTTTTTQKSGAPTPSTITVNIDTLKTNKATAKLSPTNNNEINTEKDITVYEKDKDTGKYENKSDRFYVDSYDTKSDTIVIKAKKNVPDGKYTAQIELECKDGKQYTINAVINVKNSEAPEITLAQSKFKTFYKDSTSTIAVKCEKEIENVELVSDVFKGEYKDGNVTVTYYEPVVESEDEINKVITLKIKLPEFDTPIEKSFELRTDDEKPSLKLNPSKEKNNDSTEINLALDGNSGDVEIYDEVNEEYIKAKDIKNFPKWIARFRDGEDNALIFDLVEILDDKSSGGIANIEVQKSNWISPIKVNYDVKISSELPTASPEREIMTLNRLLNALEDEIKINYTLENLECRVKTELTDSPFGADVQEANNWFDFSYENGLLKVKFKDGYKDAAKSGSYTFSVTPTAIRKHKETDLEPFTLYVAVKDSEPKLKLSKRFLKENAKFGDGDATVVGLDYYSKSMGEITMTNCSISNDMVVSYDKETGKLNVRKSESQNAGQHLIYFGKASFSMGDRDLGSTWFAVIEVSFMPKVTVSAVTIDKESTDNATSTVEISDEGYSVADFEGLESDENVKFTFNKEKMTLDVALTDAAKAKDAQTFKVELTPVILSESTNHTAKGDPVTVKVHMEGFF